MNIKDLLFSLSDADCAGSESDAADIAEKLLSQFCETERRGNTVIGNLRGEGKTLLLDAHIDEIAMTVTDIDQSGFLTVAPCGGIDLRTLTACPVTVHGKHKIPAVFCSTPPHLGGESKNTGDISQLRIDSLLGAEAAEIISLGDMVTFRTHPAELLNGRVTGKAFDNRACVSCLIELAARLSGKKLPVNTVFLFSDQEELGIRGAKTAAFELFPDEAISLDTSFGDGPDVSPYECGKLGDGPMIGISPVLNTVISQKLKETAENEKIKYQIEVMGGRTGTTADAISVTRSGIPTGLLSIPIRNMHSPAEVLDLKDLSAACDLLEKYILSGGAFNA